MQSATNKVSSLRYLSDKGKRHLRELEVLHQDINQDVFVSIIRSKLPDAVLLQLEIQKGPSENERFLLFVKNCEIMLSPVKERQK